MLNQQIAEKIRAKLGSLVGSRLNITNPVGQVLASSSPQPPSLINLADTPWAIPFSSGGQTVGWVVPEQKVANQETVAPLIRSIAELVLEQAVTIEQLPRQEEQFDTFMYDLLYGSRPDEAQLAAESQLFDLDLQQPRIVIAIRINDSLLTGQEVGSASDRELQLSRYKFGIRRALDSFYTGQQKNIVAYLGGNLFGIFKELPAGSELAGSIDSFKRSLGTIHDILKVEIRQPATIGVGNYHPGIEGLRQSFQEALNAIELGLQNWDWDGNRIYHIDDFGVVAPLLSGVDENNISFSRDLLDRLGENDEIIQTLETFFASDMSLTTTAAKLKIHRNTLVYRLERIKGLLSLDPRAFHDAAQIKLAILYKKFVGMSHATQ